MGGDGAKGLPCAMLCVPVALLSWHLRGGGMQDGTQLSFWWLSWHPRCQLCQPAAAHQQIMKDKWINIGYEGDELKPYKEPEEDFGDTKRIGEGTVPTWHHRGHRSGHSGGTQMSFRVSIMKRGHCGEHQDEPEKASGGTLDALVRAQCQPATVVGHWGGCWDGHEESLRMSFRVGMRRALGWAPEWAQGGQLCGHLVLCLLGDAL